VFIVVVTEIIGRKIRILTEYLNKKSELMLMGRATASV